MKQMKNQKKKPLKQFLKFSNLGIQMGIIIGFGSDLGFRLDNYFKLGLKLYYEKAWQNITAF